MELLAFMARSSTSKYQQLQHFNRSTRPDVTNPTRPQVNRTLVLVLAIACMVAGIAIGYFINMENIWCGSFIRVSLLLGAFWIAMPTKGRAAAWADISPWSVAGIVAVLLFVVRRPRVFIPIILVVLVLMYLIPKLIGTKRR